MNVLVLGGDGFLGSHVVEALLCDGHNVTVFDRCTSDTVRNLAACRNKITLRTGQFANRNDIRRAVQGQDLVYHFIWLSSPVTSWDDPFLEVDENIRHSLQLFELAAEAGVKKLAFVSSGGTVYGKKRGLLDELTETEPFSPYGVAKLATEHFLHYVHMKTGMATEVYRVGNAYGPRQPMHSPQGVIAVWMAAILERQAVKVYGDASSCRDYIYVGDVARLLMRATADMEPAFDVYNVGTGHATSILELLDIFKRVIDVPFEYEIHSKRGFDNTSVMLNPEKLLRHFPEFAFCDLEAMIKKTWSTNVVGRDA